MITPDKDKKGFPKQISPPASPKGTSLVGKDGKPLPTQTGKDGKPLPPTPGKGSGK